MIDKTTAIHSLCPKAEWVMNDGVIDWLDTIQKQPTQSEIDAEIIRLQAEYNGNKFQRDRAAAYLPLQEQLDMLYWDTVNGTSIWCDSITKLKKDIPKP